MQVQRTVVRVLLLLMLALLPVRDLVILAPLAAVILAAAVVLPIRAAIRAARQARAEIQARELAALLIPAPARALPPGVIRLRDQGEVILLRLPEIQARRELQARAYRAPRRLQRRTHRAPNPEARHLRED
jgi:hypothetical protein